MKRIASLLIGCALLFGGAACGDDTTPDAQTGTQPTVDAGPTPTPALPEDTGPEEVATDDAVVEIVDFAYEPQRLRLTAGKRVEWRNSGDAPHTVTAQGRAFDSKQIDPGETFEQEFSLPGRVAYFCNIHGAARMSGVVNVVAG